MLTPDQDRTLSRLNQDRGLAVVQEGFGENGEALIQFPDGTKRLLDRWGHDDTFQPPQEDTL